MSISQIYKQKSEALNAVLLENALNNNQKGEGLFTLINNRQLWGNYYNHALAPFHLPELTSPNGLFSVNANLYGDFFKKIENLLNEQVQIEQRMNVFLAWFVNDIQRPQHQIDGFFGFVNGVYLATFFLMLKYPEKHLVNFRKPRNQIGNHPLVLTGIVDSGVLQGMITPHQKIFNFGIYNKLNNHIIKQRNITNFIDFIGTLEDEYQQAQDKKTDNKGK